MTNINSEAIDIIIDIAVAEFLNEKFEKCKKTLESIKVDFSGSISSVQMVRIQTLLASC